MDILTEFYSRLGDLRFFKAKVASKQTTGPGQQCAVKGRRHDAQHHQRRHLKPATKHGAGGTTVWALHLADMNTSEYQSILESGVRPHMVLTFTQTYHLIIKRCNKKSGLNSGS